jgi:minichromosome maintenance protein 10
MVVVRESPRAHLSPDKNPEQWPPRSPFQALLSSPSGRRKWQEHGRREGSPSPVKMRDNAQSATQAMSLDSEDEDVEDEDEEMLQLKLQAIQAKLKLKKLQKAKKEGGDDGNSVRASSRTDLLPTSPQRRRPLQNQRPLRATESSVEVPLSPTRERQLPAEPVSPARRRLGLNAPAKAAEVSLKRARDGTQIKRTDSLRSERVAQASKPLSFSERLNQSRTDAQDHQAKQERIHSVRSTGFGSTHTSTFSEVLRSTALNGHSTPPSEGRSKRPSSAHQMNSPTKLEREPAIARSASTRTSRPGRSGKPRVDGLFAALSQDNHTSKSEAEQDNSTSGQQSLGYDTFSQIHLSKRNIPHVDVARAMADKEIYTLPRLLKEVKAPHYDPPDCESDFVVFAVLASKSSPFDQKAAHRTSDESKAQDDAFDAPRNKFMVFRLTDLQWEVDCFLFGTAFDQFWKLTPGTLLAILNPGIMAPKGNQNTGQFSLKLGSSEDCVMEIGVARDLGFCIAVKKDGSQCGSWVNKTSTEICDFHMELEIDRNRKHRMEVNTMWRGRSKENKRPNSSQVYGFERKGEKEKKQNTTYHREFGRLYTVPGGGGGGRSAASLLDAEDMAHGAEQEEQSRKRIADAQRERDLARKLGEMGTGVGAEYMKIKSSSSITTSVRSTTSVPASSSAEARHELFAKPSAAELGLLANKASDQHLSPAKDRKRHFGLGAMSTTGADAVGWSGARKPGLLLPRDKPRERSPQKGQTKLDLSPQKPSLVRQRSQDGSLNHSPKKKARFMLEKGLREPGRESGGVEMLKADVNHESEEDDLDIV